MVEGAGQLEVRVRSLDGQQLQLKVPSHLRVAELKLRLQELGWPAPGVTQFHLFLRVCLFCPPFLHHTSSQRKFVEINALITNPALLGFRV